MDSLATRWLHAALIAGGAYNNPNTLGHAQILPAKPVRHINHHDRRRFQFHRADVADDSDDLILFPASPECQAGAANRVLARPKTFCDAFGNHDDLSASI